MSIRGELIRLAAEMVQCHNMPSSVQEDWAWPKSTPVSVRRNTLADAAKAREQCRQRGIKIRELSDRLEGGK